MTSSLKSKLRYKVQFPLHYAMDSMLARLRADSSSTTRILIASDGLAFTSEQQFAPLIANRRRIADEFAVVFDRQLIDDVLDYRSDPATRGKNLGDDLAEGKPTLPLIHALARCEPARAAMIREVIKSGGGPERMQEIMATIESTGGLEYTARLAQTEADAALAALAALPESPYRQALAALVRFAIARQH